MTGKDRDQRIREIAAQLRLIKDIPVKALDDDTNHNLIIARNHLKAITAARYDTKALET